MKHLALATMAVIVSLGLHIWNEVPRLSAAMHHPKPCVQEDSLPTTRYTRIEGRVEEECTVGDPTVACGSPDTGCPPPLAIAP